MKITGMMLMIGALLLVACSDTNPFHERYALNDGKFSADILIDKGTQFTQEKHYDVAVIAITRALDMYNKENNQEGIRKANGLLCQIYQDYRPELEGTVLNRYYSPERARIACKKAGISMSEAK